MRPYTLFLAALLTVACFMVNAQVMVDEKEIEPLVREWNYANNTRNPRNFENIYAKNLLFYTEKLSHDKSIAIKQKLFKAKPDFSQKITGDITYTPYTAGVIKCEFTKEVYEKSRWRAYNAYLLVSYDNNRYWITGESDTETDRVLKYTLDIGEPMQLEKQDGKFTGDNIEQSEIDSAAIYTVRENESDSIIPKKIKTEFSSFYAFVSAPERVVVRRDYVFLLTAMLLVGGLMIFIAGGIQNRRLRNVRSYEKQQDKNDHSPVQEAARHSQFEAFAITLFDPLFFRCTRVKQKSLAGHDTHNDVTPELEIYFNRKDISAKFAAQCIYLPNLSNDPQRLPELDNLQTLNRYENEQGMPVYYIIGIGGTPVDPQELYLVPVKDLRSMMINRDILKPFYKSGMFFYNASTGKLY